MLNNNEEIRVGVYVCHCGGNISDVVDVESVKNAAAKFKNVVVSKKHMFMCSDPGQNLIFEDIKEHKLNRIVVAACSPSLHEATFRETLTRSGLNSYLYEHVNLREQVSWCSKSDPDGATQKAILLVKAGVAKANLLKPLENIQVQAQKHVLVIGAGITGLKAASDLSKSNFKVTLIEKEDVLGGQLTTLGKVYPSEVYAQDILKSMTERVVNDPNITVYKKTELKAFSGFVGNFDVCLSTESGEKELKAGAIIVASGFDSYQPKKGEYGYLDFPYVVTMPEYIKILKEHKEDQKELMYDGKKIKNIAMIHCVGSRQMQGVHAPDENGKVNEYCSRICCTTALKVANETCERFQNTNVFSLYQDIRTYGRGHEDYYLEAKGVRFIRYKPEEAPVVKKPEEEENIPLLVTVKDTLTFDEELEVPVDLVVLVTGMVPKNNLELINLLKLPRSDDGFFQEVHPKLRPVEFATRGLFLAGTCQAPMDISESCSSASAAVAKTVALLNRGFIELEPFVAQVDLNKCQGHGTCVQECKYQKAVTLIDVEQNGSLVKKAKVNPALCKGCGMCAAVCPNEAINVAGWQLNQFRNMVEAIAVNE